jgi:hypothetical protein
MIASVTPTEQYAFCHTFLVTCLEGFSNEEGFLEENQGGTLEGFQGSCSGELTGSTSNDQEHFR